MGFTLAFCNESLLVHRQFRYSTTSVLRFGVKTGLVLYLAERDSQYLLIAIGQFLEMVIER